MFVIQVKIEAFSLLEIVIKVKRKHVKLLNSTLNSESKI